MKKTHLAAALAAVMMLSSCGVNSTLKKTAIEVGKVKVSAGDIAVMTEATMEYMGADFDTTKKEMAKQIESSFKYGELGKAMGIELSDEDIASSRAIRANYAKNGGGYKAYEEFLKANGSDMEFLDELFIASAYNAKIVEKVNEEFEGKDATDDELKKYYNDSFYCAKHVLIPKEASDDNKNAGKDFADDILAKAKKGDDFDALMNEYSQDPGSKSVPNGYVFTDGDMVSEFEETVKSLKPGEIGFCESSYGYHIIKRLDLPSFDDNRDTVSSKYSSKRVDDRIEALYEEHKITSKINDDVVGALKEDMVKKQEKTEDSEK